MSTPALARLRKELKAVQDLEDWATTRVIAREIRSAEDDEREAVYGCQCGNCGYCA